MKKLALFATVAISLCAVSAVEAQDNSSTTTPRKTHRTTVSTRNSAAVTARLRRIEAQTRSITTTAPQGPRVDGSVVRAARSGNPLQMINPFAPKEYGDGRDVTRHEPDDAFQRPEGLKLFVADF